MVCGHGSTMWDNAQPLFQGNHHRTETRFGSKVRKFQLPASCFSLYILQQCMVIWDSDTHVFLKQCIDTWLGMRHLEINRLKAWYSWMLQFVTIRRTRNYFLRTSSTAICTWLRIKVCCREVSNSEHIDDELQTWLEESQEPLQDCLGRLLDHHQHRGALSLRQLTRINKYMKSSTSSGNYPFV